MAKKETELSVLKEIRDVLVTNSTLNIIVKGAKELKNITRFVDNGDGTIIDKKTGLVWVKSPHTDLPDNFKKELTWKDAIQACKDLNFAGHKDWRLPTVEELASLVDYSKREPAIDTKVFPDTKSSWYWSSTPLAGNDGVAWYVYFYGGGVDDGYKSSRHYVRPVCSSQ